MENGVDFWQGQNPPLAIIDRTSTGENEPVIINVQANDLDYINNGLTTTIIGTSTQGIIPTILNNDSLDLLMRFVIKIFQRLVILRLL